MSRLDEGNRVGEAGLLDGDVPTGLAQVVSRSLARPPSMYRSATGYGGWQKRYPLEMFNIVVIRTVSLCVSVQNSSPHRYSPTAESSLILSAITSKQVQQVFHRQLVGLCHVAPIESRFRDRRFLSLQRQDAGFSMIADEAKPCR